MGTIHAGERWGGGAGATKFTTVAALSHRVGGRAGGGRAPGGGACGFSGRNCRCTGFAPIAYGTNRS